MLKYLNTLLTGNPYSLGKDFIEALGKRNRFAPFLPYRYFDDERNIYLNVDGTLGMIWECQPLIFADTRATDLFTSLLNQPFEDDTILQWMLYADPNLDWMFQRHLQLQQGDSLLARKAAERTVAFFKAGTHGIEKLQDIPVRDFRLWVAIKSAPGAKYELFKDYINTVYEAAKGANLAPQPMLPGHLVNNLAKIFNSKIPDFEYDEKTVLNEQILSSDTPIVIHKDHLAIGDKIWKCMSVKKFPERIDELTMNYLCGDWEGVTGDSNQILNPFLMTVNVIYRDMSSMLHRNCNMLLQQKFMGSFASTLKLKQDELMWATGELEQMTKFVRIMPMVWHWSKDQRSAEKNGARVRRLWDARGFIPQEDRVILFPMLLSGLPFGLYTQKKNVDFLNRDFICQPKVAAKALPVQADFKGGSEPVVLLVGRKGQLQTLDLFDKRAGNFNAIVCAKSGKGKSFLLNYIIEPYLNMGVLARIIDLGRSFQKLASMHKGKFLQFQKGADICLNPFSYIADIEDSLQSVASVISQMIYSATNRAPDEGEASLLEMAIKFVWEEFGNEGNIDRVYDVLRRPKQSLKELEEFRCESDETCLSDIQRGGQAMAFNLMKFTSKGEYGKLFNGRSNLDFVNEQLVVLELDELKASPKLFRVVTLQLVNMMINELYISKSRGIKEIVLFEEAWQYLDNDNIAKDEINLLGKIVSEGYRRARKYGGSFITVLQSILDYGIFGKNAQAILQNSDFRFLLESSDFDMAAQQKLINYGSFGLQILNSIKSSRPKYSEIFVDTPFGKGPARLVVDPFKYYLSTTDAGEVGKLEQLVGMGMTWDQAIEHLVENNGNIGTGLCN